MYRTKVCRSLATLVVVALMGCNRASVSWPAIAAGTGCTRELLERTAAYDSSRVRSLVGSYRLVQIDTARGWVELDPPSRDTAQWPQLRLWLADSLHAHWRRLPFRDSLVAANRPIAGAVAGYENKGFTPDNPQAEVTSRALDYLVIKLTPELMLDGGIGWLLPIQRLGPWGFGGYFVERANVVPPGRDGKPLGQRAGYYCAFRQLNS